MTPFTKLDIQKFCNIIGTPDFLLSWLDRFYSIAEIQLILDLNDGKKVKADQNFIDRCYKKGVIDYDVDMSLIPDTFHSRYEKWALFEGWLDVPEDIKKALNNWEFDDYRERHREELEIIKNSGKRDPTIVWPEYVLLNETMHIIDLAPSIYQWPCNCRAMVKGCHKPEYVCLRFDNEKGLGWEISKDRAKKLVREAHKKGLMQSAELALNNDHILVGAICNCCSDCCYPQRLAREESIQSEWPIKRYEVIFHQQNCSNCGRCTKRCPFQAFRLLKGESTNGKTCTKTTVFDPDLCRGCGLCATTCPDNAIEMKPARPSSLSIISSIFKLK